MREEELKKIYNPYGYMKKIITELVTLSPIFDNFTTNSKNKIKPLKKSLKQMNWNMLRSEIIETLETKGDFYAYWFYETSNIEKLGWNKRDDGIWENPIPRVKVLESENITEVTIDNTNTITGFTYKETFVKETIDDTTGNILNTQTYDVTTIFKKGYIRVNDPVNYPDKGYMVFPNKEWEKDIIRMIYVPSFKKQKDKFSYIPAIDYLDPVLLLNYITSDIRYINRLAGFPINWIIDLDIDWDNSSLMPGGVIKSNTNPSSQNQGKYQSVEIKSELKTLQYERDLVNKDLYKKIGLIREELEEKMGSSDSSRVLSQLRLTLESKFEKYCNNIAEGFAPYFESLLKANNLWSKTDDCITFEMPDIYVNTSIFDDLAIKNTKLAIGETSMQEEWDKKGLTEEEKKVREDNINRDIMMGQNDISISPQVMDVAKNGQATKMDNQMKQEKNIKTGL